MSTPSALKALQVIPGVGVSVAQDLHDLGVRRVADLVGRSAEEMYEASCRLAGVRIDRCLLYVYRCAVYFAETREPDAELLKWWNWKDRPSPGSGRRKKAVRPS